MDKLPIATGDAVQRLTRDLAKAAATLTTDEARFLVDYYYITQEDRKRAGNQERALDEDREPHGVLSWLFDQSATIENQIKRALDAYTNASPLGQWARDHYGIGPVIAAGLLAHIDLERAPTAGHIWRYAGLDPTVKWEKGQKRPWNSSLKTLCWKIGQSFMKFHGQEECFYGHIYLARKQYEVERNDKGVNAELCKTILAGKNFSKTTDAFKHYTSGKLPPAQIDARARRYAVKIFLSHYHAAGYRLILGKEPPVPFPIAHMGHTHMIEAPVKSHLK